MPSGFFTFFGIRGSVTDNRPGEERTARVSAGVKSEIDIEDLRTEKILQGAHAQRWKAFANRARLPEPAVLKAVIDIVERVNEHWSGLPERAVIPEEVLERIDGHVKAMTLILRTCAE